MRQLLAELSHTRRLAEGVISHIKQAAPSAHQALTAATAVVNSGCTLVGVMFYTHDFCCTHAHCTPLRQRTNQNKYPNATFMLLVAHVDVTFTVSKCKPAPVVCIAVLCSTGCP